MTDQQALSEYAETKDAEAFRHLVGVYERLVYSAARRKLADPHDVEDVVQQTFLELASSCHSVREDVGSWLYTTALHNAGDLIRKDQTRRRHEALVVPPAPADAGEHILSQEEWRTLSPKIDDAILALPPDERTLVIQHFFQNRSQRELAEGLGVAHTTVQRRLNAAIGRIRRALRASGHLPAAPALVATLHGMSGGSVPGVLTAQLTKIGIVGSGVRASATLKTTIVAGKSKALLAQPLLWLAVLLAASGSFLWFILHRERTMPAAAPPVLVTTAPAPPTAVALKDSMLSRDDWFPSPGQGQPGIRLASDMAGNIYAFGRIYDQQNQPHGIVRQKPTGQIPWKTIYDSAVNRLVWALLATPDGLYIAVSAPEGLQIQSRPAGQEVFEPVPGATFSRNASGTAGFARDEDGTLYFAYSSGGHWLVEKQSRGTGPFTRVEDFPGLTDPVKMIPSELMAPPLLIRNGPSAGIYLAGHANTSTPDATGKATVGGTHWIVRRSSNEGRTWATVDRVAVGNGDEVEVPYGACVDARGAIYVTGFAGAMGCHWITRRSATGEPGSWETVDDYSSEMRSDWGAAIVSDPAGNVYAAGAAGAPPGGGNNPDRPHHALLRTNSGSGWHTVDDVYSAGNNALWKDLLFGPDGTLYSAGIALEADGRGWMIHSAAPQVLQDNRIRFETARRVQDAP